MLPELQLVSCKQYLTIFELALRGVAINQLLTALGLAPMF
jgi:hypothetical protein